MPQSKTEAFFCCLISTFVLLKFTMKILFKLLPILILALSVSCKKDNPNTQDDLQRFAMETKMYQLSVLGNQAMMSFVESHGQKDIVAKFQYKKATESNWIDAVYSDKNNILLASLSTKTMYHIRVALSKGTEIRYSNVDSFKTKSFYINYDKFFSGPANLHDNSNGIFSIEGAKHTIFGGGFSNEAAIKVAFVSIENAADVFTVDATIVDDSTLYFNIPRNLIADLPYLRNKVYSCTIGEVPLVGFKSYTEKNFAVRGDLSITNRDIHIASFTTEAVSCRVVTLYGFFATHETESVTPVNVYDISMRLNERKLIIRNATTGDFLTEVSILPTGSPLCDAEGRAYADFVSLNKTMIYYHEVLNVVFKTTLPNGAYSVQLKQTSQDGSVLTSNIFNINL